MGIRGGNFFLFGYPEGVGYPIFRKKRISEGEKRGFLGGGKKKATEAVLGYFLAGKTGHKGIRLESEGPRQLERSFKPFWGVFNAVSVFFYAIFGYFSFLWAVLRPSFAVVGFFSSISGAVAVVVDISRRSKTLFILSELR